MPIREALLLGVAGLLCLAALVRPRFGLYGYIWYALTRPDVLAWVDGVHPISMALAVSTLVGSIRYLPGLISLTGNPICRTFLLMHVPIGLSVIFCEGQFLSSDRYSEFVKTSVIVLLIPLVITSTRHVMELLFAMGTMILLGARFGMWGLAHGGVAFDAAYSNVYDNNTLGLGFAISVPIVWYCRDLVSSRLARVVLGGLMAANIPAIVMTNSRGASLSLAVAILLIIWRSKSKFLPLIVLAAVVAGSAWLVQDQYVKRMSTLANIQDKDADSGSAYSRVVFARAAFEMWQNYPILGVGFGGRNYARLSGKYLGEDNIYMVHNSYMQMLVDSGIIAFALYMWLLFGTIRWLGLSVARVRQIDPKLASIPLALQTGLITFAIGSTFYSCQRADILYFLVMGAAAWYWVDSQLAARGQSVAEAKAPAQDMELELRAAPTV